MYRTCGHHVGAGNHKGLPLQTPGTIGVEGRTLVVALACVD
jgi:hypothetical protein